MCYNSYTYSIRTNTKNAANMRCFPELFGAISVASCPSCVIIHPVQTHTRVHIHNKFNFGANM